MSKKLLSQLLPELNLSADLSRLEIANVASSTNDLIPGSLFFAIKGQKFDGNQFIPQAIKNGAVAVVTSENLESNIQVPVVVLKDIRNAYAFAQSRFYDESSNALKCIGVTGTNGKTSTAWILMQSLLALEGSSYYSGTLGLSKFKTLEEVDIKNIVTSEHTTPDAGAIQNLIHQAKSENIKSLVLEVSSHALDQSRVAYINWDVAVFTNLTQDHLDYHLTMENYAEVKKRFFTSELVQSCKKEKFAVINIDDILGQVLYQEKLCSNINKISYSPSGKQADVSLSDSQLSTFGSILRIKLNNELIELQTQLIGNYNIENTLASVATLYGLGFTKANIVDTFLRVKAVPGRLERVDSLKRNIFVDYAHTPDALIQVQKSLKKIAPRKLFTVFGCGGDRDKTKRPLMGKAVSDYSDFAIVTSDNPRSEVPEDIISNIQEGISQTFPYDIVPDRRVAIEKVIQMTTPEDVILIAGKGHEDYQIIKGVKHHFSDVEVAKEILEKND